MSTIFFLKERVEGPTAYEPCHGWVSTAECLTPWDCDLQSLFTPCLEILLRLSA